LIFCYRDPSWQPRLEEGDNHPREDLHS
jgi:hypothetical protein